MRLSFVVSLVVVASLGAAPGLAEEPALAAPGKRAVRIAVYDFELSGVDERVGKLVSSSVLVELRKLERVSVIGMAEIRQMLDFEAERQMAGCDDAESCLADLAGALGADVLVTGTLARVGDEHIFGMKRMDHAEARVVGSVQRRLVAEDGEELLAVVGPAILELFPEHAVRAGETRGVAEEVALRLNPPPLPTWAFWSVAAGTGVLATSSCGALGLHLLLRAQYDGRVTDAQRAPGEWRAAKDAADAANLFAATTWVLAAGALAGGVAAGTMALFTDWRGYGDAALE